MFSVRLSVVPTLVRSLLRRSVVLTVLGSFVALLLGRRSLAHVRSSHVDQTDAFGSLSAPQAPPVRSHNRRSRPKGSGGRHGKGMADDAGALAASGTPAVAPRRVESDSGLTAGGTESDAVKAAIVRMQERRTARLAETERSVADRGLERSIGRSITR